MKWKLIKIGKRSKRKNGITNIRKEIYESSMIKKKCIDCNISDIFSPVHIQFALVAVIDLS